MTYAIKGKRDAAETHDYTRRTWGHDFTISQIFNGGRRLRLAIWGPGFRKGDFLILPQGGNATTRYKITGVDYCGADPGDMYFLDAKFAPRYVSLSESASND